MKRGDTSDRRRIPPGFRIQRVMVLSASSLLLANALLHGPGRGMTVIPADHPHAALFAATRVAVYGLFLAGAMASGRRPGLAAVLLATGLAGRTALEWSFSLGRMWTDQLPCVPAEDTLLLVGFYWGSFVLPALFGLDCLRSWKSPAS